MIVFQARRRVQYKGRIYEPGDTLNVPDADAPEVQRIYTAFVPLAETTLPDAPPHDTAMHREQVRRKHG